MRPRLAATSPTPEELAAPRALQALAYQCAEAIAAGLSPGITERDAARRMLAWLAARGVHDYFHKPFAWFGARTALRWRNPLRFMPSGQRLADGMPYILDLAPLHGGWVADIGYAACLGRNALHARMLQDLAAYRGLILAGVRAREPLAEIYRAVDRLAVQQGYDVRHKAYPGQVLAHRVDRIADRSPPRFVLGFGTKGLASLGMSLVGGVDPFWNGSRRSERPPEPGLWAVEPHIAAGDIGVKFEELLVITADDAFWLDDDLPHVRRWPRSDAAVGA